MKKELTLIFENNILMFPETIKDGKYTAKQFHNTRTKQQNKYYWVILTMISPHTGYTEEELHEIFKLNFLGYTKKGRRFGKSTTNLKTKEFMEFMNKVLIFGETFYNLKFPTPEEYKFDKLAKVFERRHFPMPDFNSF